MWSGDRTGKLRSGGIQKLPLPGVFPSQAPAVYIAVNPAWLPYIVGALSQMMHPAYWDTNNDAALTVVQCQVSELLSLVGNASSVLVPMFQLSGLDALQYSTDGGQTWQDVGYHMTASLPFVQTSGADYIGNGDVAPLLYNGGAGVPLRNGSPGGGLLLSGPGMGAVYTRAAPNLPIRFR
jgi:hypothetical protein